MLGEKFFQLILLVCLQSLVSACEPGFALIPGSGVGDVFVAAGKNFISSFTYSGYGFSVGPQTVIAGKSGSSGYADGVGNVARFTDISSMVVLPNSNEIVAADGKNLVLRKIDAVSKQVTTFAGMAQSGAVVADYIDGPGNSSTFSTMGSLSLTLGSVYVGILPLRVVTFPDVIVSTLYKPYTIGTSDGTLGATGALTNSFVASISPNGKFLILSDKVYHTIRRIDLPELRVATIGGGIQGCLDGIGTNARFDTPGKILITSNSSLVYIADVNNLAVRVMDLLTLQVWTLIGTCPPATQPAMSSGERVSRAVQDMVISSDEKFIVAITEPGGVLASIRLDTSFVAFLDVNSWNYMMFWQSLTVIPAKGSTCQLCSQGTYSPKGSTCLQCSAGMLCVAGSGNQTQCPAGNYCSNASTLSIAVCESGSFCPAGSHSQTLCPAGFYCVNSSVKIECPSGNYCPEGSTRQDVCPSGFFCRTASSKSECNLGCICPAGSTEPKPCPSGFYCENTTSQLACPLGSFCGNGSVSPSDCPSGSFCPSPDLKMICPEWGVCPTGSSAPIPRPNGSVTCEPGYEPTGGIHDVVLWIGKWGIQSMVYGGDLVSGEGGAIELVAGNEVASGKTDGVGEAVRFGGLSSAVLLPGTSDLVIADRSNNILRKLDYKTRAVSTILDVISVSGVPQNIDGVGTSASIRGPTYLSIAENSNVIYVSTSSGLRTVKYPGLLVGSIPVASISFSSVKTALSGDGKFLILTDYSTNLVHRFDIATSLVTTAGGVGSPSGCRDGAGSNALFDYPSSVVILSNGTRAYISDNFNHAIRILDLPSMQVSTLVAGTCPTSLSMQSLGWVDGMVFSNNETVLLVLLTYTYSLSRVELSSGHVSEIKPLSGSFMAGVNIALIPNVPPWCAMCDPGRVSLNGGSCDLCPTGFVCTTPTSKKECKIGSFCEEGSTVEIKCPTGFYCPSASEKLICPLGSFCASGSILATPCSPGYVCPNPSSKQECKSGSYCSSGSTVEIPCPAGYFCPSPSEKLSCPLGSFCVSGSISPQVCPLGTFCYEGSSSPVKCPAGYVCLNSQSKTKCQSGSYCGEGSASETRCPASYYCPSPSVKLECPRGSFCEAGSLTPTECRAGTVCTAGSSAYVLCPAGSLCLSDGLVIPCPVGSYCVAGSSVAVACPLQSTSPEGSKFVDECVCDAGFLRSMEATCEQPEIIITTTSLPLELIISASIGGVALVGAGGWWVWRWVQGKKAGDAIVPNLSKVKIKEEDVPKFHL